MRHGDAPVNSHISTQCLPANCGVSPTPLLLPAARRQFTCFLRTKSDGAIGGSGLTSQLPCVAGAVDKPVTVTLQALSRSLQDQNRVNSGQGICDIKLRKRKCEAMKSNFTQWSALKENSVCSEVAAENLSCENDVSVESNKCQQKVPKPSKNVSRDLCWMLPTESPADMQPFAKVSGRFEPMSTIYLNGRFAGLAESQQEVPTAGQLDVSARDIISYTAVPLSSSNIINVNHSHSTLGQNVAATRRVIVIKRRQNLPST